MNARSKKLLKEIVKAHQDREKIYCDGSAKELMDEGFIQVNTNDVDPTDEEAFACYPTEAGLLEVGAAVETESDSEFGIDNDVPMPKIMKKSSNKYPFDALQEIEKDSFHVPVTEKMPEPHKSIASAVSAANKRYIIDTGKVTEDAEGNEIPVMKVQRKFAVRRVDKSDPRGPGARVYRVK